MKNTVSVKKNTHFKLIYNNGKSHPGHHIVVITLPNNETFNRLGITVSKKVGGSVVRNRVKRLIREAYRLNEHRFATGLDIIVIAKKNAATASFHEIEKALMRLFRSVGAIK